MSAPSITIYHDLSSTFSYPALYLLTTAPFTTSGAKLHIVPIFLGGVFQSTGNTPPPMIPAKRDYLVHDFARKCRKFSVPLRAEFPKPFPFNSVYAQRAAVAVGQLFGEETQARVICEMQNAFWGTGELKNPADKKELEALLEKWLGDREKARKVAERLGEKEVKDGLAANTKEALEKGAFGAPWMVVKMKDGREVKAWGVDALDVVAEAVGVQWPPREVKASL